MKNTTTLSGLITKAFAFTLIVSLPMVASAANYNYIDVGDRYYINGFGNNNQYVEVVRKFANPNVKVRDLHTYETQVVSASKLLTQSELHQRENLTKFTGIAAGAILAFCLINKDKCK